VARRQAVRSGMMAETRERRAQTTGSIGGFWILFKSMRYSVPVGCARGRWQRLGDVEGLAISVRQVMRHLARNKRDVD
jgi:hypothetical protein